MRTSGQENACRLDWRKFAQWNYSIKDMRLCLWFRHLWFRHTKQKNLLIG